MYFINIHCRFYIYTNTKKKKFRIKYHNFENLSRLINFLDILLDLVTIVEEFSKRLRFPNI